MKINNFWRDGDMLYLDLGEDTEDTYVVAIDSDATWHARPFSPIEINAMGISETDYLYFNAEYHSMEAIDLRAAVDAYNAESTDPCDENNGRVASLDDSIFIADVFNENNEEDVGYIIDWQPLYDYLMSLFNKCNCAKCQPPLELVTTILAYYDMTVSLKNLNTGRFLKVWFKTMRDYNNVRSGCGCNDR